MQLNQTAFDLRNKLFWYSMILFFTLLVSFPLYTNSVIVGHDIIFHLDRIEGIANSLAGGDFPTRIHTFAIGDYGLPTGYFYPELFLYLPAILRLAGIPIAVSYNIYCFFVNCITALATGWAMITFFRSVRLGSIATIIYLTALYRLVDMYSRAAVGEASAMAFMPLAIIGVYLTIYRDTKYWPSMVIGFTGILSSHILSIFILGSIVVPMILVAIPKITKKIAVSIGKAFIFIITLNIWFYYPFYDAYKIMDFHMKASAIKIQNELISLSDSAFNLDSFLNIQGFLGWPTIILLVSLWLVYIYQNKTHNNLGKYFYIIMLCTIVATFSMTTGFPWDFFTTLPLIGSYFGVLQFPFRMAMFSTLGITIIIPILLRSITANIRFKNMLLCVILAGLMLNNIISLQNMTSYYHGNPFDWSIHYDGYQNESDRRNWLRTLDWIFVDYLFTDIPRDDLILDELRNVDGVYYVSRVYSADQYIPPKHSTDYEKRGTMIKFISDSNESHIAELPLFDYPEYKAVNQNGENISLKSSSKHVLQIDIPAGHQEILISYHEPFKYRVAELISLMALFSFVYMLYRMKIYGINF